MSPLPSPFQASLALLALFCTPCATCAAPEPAPTAALLLTCELDQRVLPLVSVAGEDLIVGDEHGRTTLSRPQSVRWTVSGDVAASANLIAWSPSYAIERDPRSTLQRYRGRVALMHLRDRAPLPNTIKDRTLAEYARTIERPQDPLAESWPDGGDRPAALVAVWMVDAHITQVQVRAIPFPGADRDFRLEFEFPLTERERAGRAALLLWRDGAFVTPRTQWDHGPTQRAFVATMLDDSALLEGALRDGARLGDTATADNATLAHFAAESGSAKCLGIILARKPKLIDALTRNGNTPLHWAVRAGRTEVARSCLAASRPGGESFRTLDQALLTATRHGHTDLFALLLETGGSSLKPEIFEQVRDEALQLGYPEILHRVPQPAGKPETPPDMQANKKRTENQARALLVRHAALGALPAVEYLVSTLHTDPNIPDGGTTPLSAAAGRGHAEIVDFLLRSGADANLAQGDVSPLMAAANADDPHVVELLLKAGAKPNQADKDGVTALHLAAGRNAAAIVALLLDAGADTQVCSIRDITPLDTAILAGATDTARQLVDRGACIGLGAPYSLELLQAAISSDVDQALRKALDQGWPAGSTFAGVWPALRVAEVLGSTRCAEVLRTAGATSRPDKPARVVEPTALDTPLQRLTSDTPLDPRGPEEEFASERIHVRVLVDAQGGPLFPVVLDACDPRLHRAAIAAALHSRYAPPRSKGQPVAAFDVQVFEFPASRDRVFEESIVERRPSERRRERPYLPRSASRKDRAARVVVRFVVNILGRPEQIEIIESSGPAFTDAARLALSQWLFTPAWHRHAVVPVRLSRTFTFDPQSAAILHP